MSAPAPFCAERAAPTTPMAGGIPRPAPSHKALQRGLESPRTADSNRPPELPRWRPGWLRSVQDFCEELAARGYSALTQRDYRADLIRLGAEIAICPSDLSLERLESALADDEQQGFGPGVLRRRRAAYRHFHEFLRRQDDESLLERLARIYQDLLPEDRVLLALVTSCGLKLKEIATLEGRDIDWRRGELRVRSGLRILPLTSGLQSALKALEQERPRLPYRPLLPGQNGFALNPRTLHARFARLQSRVNFSDPVRPDRLRRQVCAHLLRQGTPKGLVHAFAGQDRGLPIVPRRTGWLDLVGLAPRLEALLCGFDHSVQKRASESGSNSCGVVARA